MVVTFIHSIEANAESVRTSQSHYYRRMCACSEQMSLSTTLSQQVHRCDDRILSQISDIDQNSPMQLVDKETSWKRSLIGRSTNVQIVHTVSGAWNGCRCLHRSFPF